MAETNSQTPSRRATFLLEAASPAVRKLLVRQRIRAMRGELEDALRSLRDAYDLTPDDRTHDRLALGLLHAELLHLDLQDETAAGVFDELVAPHVGGLDPEQRFAVEQDRNDLGFARWVPESAGDFYNLVDQKRVLDFEWLDYRDLFEAKQNAEQGKHYRTLPVLWQQLRRAHAHGCWRAHQWTSRLFAGECIALKMWDEALYHAIVARDDDLIPPVAEGFVSARDAELVRRAVGRVASAANLRAHFAVACKFLVAIADAIPDTEVARLAEWLRPRAAEVRTYPTGRNPVIAAWEAVQALGSRMPVESARVYVATATSHPVWTTKLDDPNRFIPERESFVKALAPLVWVLPPAELPAVAAATLPLALDRAQISDYTDVVNLLCHLAGRGGEAVKTTLCDALYPPEKPLHPILLQVAETFGKAEGFDAERLVRFARQVTRDVRLQVQRLPEGGSPEPPGEMLYEHRAPRPGGVLVVYSAPLVSLHAVARQRAKLDEASLNDLVRAVLDLAGDRDNFCSNRAGLLYTLTEFEDIVPDATRGDVIRSLEPLARGPVEESASYQNAAEASNPLSPVRHQSGTPDDVQGAALIVLAAFSRQVPAARKRLAETLEDALCNHLPSIRRAGYAAVRKLPEVTEGVLLGLLAGLRDPDPAAATAAFAALASQTGWKLTRNHWRLFLLAARSGSQSLNVKLRRHVAGALRAWSPQCPSTFQSDFRELLRGLAADISASVREFAQPVG